jgi:PIN domain nuclease of toxin-antitoxin system
MKLLLDTCTFIWLASGSRRLPERVRATFSDPDNEPYVSAVSAWEIALKHGTGKLDLPEGMDVENYVLEARGRHGIETLALEERAASELKRLPQHHADPFDRMLIAQAIAHQMAILTPDPLIHRYPIAVRW